MLRGAKELISEFWHKQKAKEQSKSKGSSAKPRKSATRDTESAAPSAVKKRKKAKDESDDDDGAGLSKASKKRGSASAKRPSSASAPAMDVDMDEDSMEGVGMMEKYMDLENWEKLIDTVDTVERGADGELYVYFTLCVAPFPSTLTIHLYLRVLTLKRSGGRKRNVIGRPTQFAGRDSHRRYVCSQLLCTLWHFSCILCRD